MQLTNDQIAHLQRLYSDLLNYSVDDPTQPIDPGVYQAPDGDRLIHIAALRGDMGTVELLLSAGESIDALGDMGSTPAHYAAIGKQRELFEWLANAGANLAILDEFGRTPDAAWDHPRSHNKLRAARLQRRNVIRARSRPVK